MKKRHIAAGCIASLMTLTTIHAEDCCLPEYRGGEPLCDACGIYTQFAGIELECGWNVFAWGEFLYWKTIRDDLWSTLKAENALFGTPVLDSVQRILPLELGYRPGFRLGIGMNLPCFDNWILNADYTWYHHNFSKTFRATEPAFLASSIAAGTPLVNYFYNSMRNRVKIAYDIVGVSVQRPNYLGQRVILSPFLGVKWKRFHQTMFQDGFNVLTNLTDFAHGVFNFDAIGLAAGFDGSWLLCWNLRLIGKADIGLLYAYNRKWQQNVHFAFPPELPTATVILRHRHKNMNLLGRGGLGVGWGNYFCCRRYHLDLAATFDWMADVIKNAFDNGMIESPATFLVGLTIRGQFDF